MAERSSRRSRAASLPADSLVRERGAKRRHTQAPNVATCDGVESSPKTPQQSARRLIAKDEPTPEGYRKKRVVRRVKRTVPVSDEARAKYEKELAEWKVRRLHKSIKRGEAHIRFAQQLTAVSSSDAIRHLLGEEQAANLAASTQRFLETQPFAPPTRPNAHNAALRRQRSANAAALAARDAELHGWKEAQSAVDAMAAQGVVQLPTAVAQPLRAGADADAKDANALLLKVVFDCEEANTRIRAIEAQTARADADVKAAVVRFNEAVLSTKRLAKTPRKPVEFPAGGEVPDASPTTTALDASPW